MCEDPAWIDIHWNSIWLRARLHMTSHSTQGPVITIHDFGSVLWWPLDTFFWGLSQCHGHGSWRVCEVVVRELHMAPRNGTSSSWGIAYSRSFPFYQFDVPKIFPNRNEWNWKHHVRKFILDMTLIFQKPPFSFRPSTHLSPKLIWSGDLIHGFKAFGESSNKEAATSLGPI